MLQFVFVNPSFPSTYSQPGRNAGSLHWSESTHDLWAHWARRTGTGTWLLTLQRTKKQNQSYCCNTFFEGWHPKSLMDGWSVVAWRYFQFMTANILSVSTATSSMCCCCDSNQGFHACKRAMLPITPRQLTLPRNWRGSQLISSYLPSMFTDKPLLEWMQSMEILLC